MGIVNGTTNYVLTRMSEEGSSFAEAVAEAQALGYAERDPTADVEGFDAAAKAAIIASIAFGARVVAGDVYREGITNITADDIAAAHELGYVVKLLAVAEERDGAVGARVHPAMVPIDHPLASVRGSYNAVFIEGATVGQLMLLLQYGNMSKDLAFHNTELFAKRVMPQLRNLFESEWENRWWPKPLPAEQRAIPGETVRT